MPKLPPDPEDMNDQRAKAAKGALDHFTEAFGEPGEDLEEQNLTDLLCDIAHYCDRNGLQLGDCLRMAREHYIEETDHKGAQSFQWELRR